MHDRTNRSFGAGLRLLVGVSLIAGLSSAAAQGPGPTKHGAWATPRAGLPSSELLKRADVSLIEAAGTVHALEARLQRPHRSGADVVGLVSGLAGGVRHMQAWRTGMDDGAWRRQPGLNGARHRKCAWTSKK